jgi:hypothetical protein
MPYGGRMAPIVGLIVTGFLLFGVLLGWHGQKATAANSDVKVAKTRLRGGRKTRMRSGLFLLVIAIVAFLAANDAMRH